MHGWQHGSARGRRVGCRKWTTDRSYARETARLENHTHGMPTVNERVRRKKDRLAFFKRYRNTTLVEHLGNLLGSIRIQKHHLIETKRPTTPLKLPHLRYRTRNLREWEYFSSLILNWQKTLTKGRVEVFITLQPFIIHGQTSQVGENTSWNKAKLNKQLAKLISRDQLPTWHLIGFLISKLRYKALLYN